MILKNFLFLKLINKSFVFTSLLFLFITPFSCQNLSGSITVDFQKDIPVNSMVGFLHFNNIYKLEPHLKQLKPKYWRFRWMDDSTEAVNLLIKNDIIPIIVLSDKYGYPDNLGKNWKTPLKSDEYKKTVKFIYSKLGNKVIYDIWNEPYMSGFGGFSSKDFFILFKEIHDLIRSLPGGVNALITGPSFEELNRYEIEKFFKFCNDNNIRFDILSWHEWRNEGDLKNMSSDIYWVKNYLLKKYPKVGIKKIVLTEIVHANIQFSPTQVLKVYDTLEKDKIDGACRGCFFESVGVINCENNSITGLLDHSGNARSIWWATKLYSQSTENRVDSNTTLEDIISFASYDKNNGYLLLANNYKHTIKNINVTFKLKGLPLFKKNKKLKVYLYKIPNTEKKPLKSPIFVYTQFETVKNGVLNLEIKNFEPQELLYMIVK